MKLFKGETMIYSNLYPVNNKFRFNRLLNGTWNFEIDPESKGISDKWYNKLPHPEEMPVPGTFAEITTERSMKYYTGDFWYETNIFVPRFLKNKKIYIRFGSVTHRGKVFLNRHKVGQHEGGFLPFSVDITNYVKFDQNNHLSILVNNELSEETLPCGTEEILSNGHKLARPYFDFFNYSGIMRNVWLVALPATQIINYDLNYVIKSNYALINYQIFTNCENKRIRVTLLDDQGKIIIRTEGKQGTLKVPHEHLWNTKDPYLYTFKIQLLNENKIVDEYESKIGIRTISIKGGQILLNNHPIYLKGFGKHEDFDILGKAVNESVIKRDFECMKWIGANCFRTSHYPYAEEWYQYADKYGFLIIDEVPAVGLVRSTRNFVHAIKGKITNFFQQATIPELKKVHKKEIQEMINRDKNHPSVIAWSLFNEPETNSDEAFKYFKNIFSFTRNLDVQNRPLTGALENHSQPDTDKINSLCDIISLNRYFGWYIKGGPQLTDAKKQFVNEMNKWKAKKLNKPFIFTEFGADTLSSEHCLPSEMWSQEYQKEIYQMFFDIFKKYDFVDGELVWNFADFKTTEGIMRIGGNKKGIFTRERQPKDAAYLLKKRWHEEV